MIRPIAFLLLLLLCTIGLAQNAPAPRDIGMSIGPAITPSGVLAFVNSNTGKLSLYRSISDAAPFAETDAARNPAGIVCKKIDGKEMLVVGDPIQRKLLVYDAATGKQLHAIAMESTPASLCVDPAAEDPFVYYSSTFTNASGERQLGRVNLATKSDEGLFRYPIGEIVNADVRAVSGSRFFCVEAPRGAAQQLVCLMPTAATSEGSLPKLEPVGRVTIGSQPSTVIPTPSGAAWDTRLFDPYCREMVAGGSMLIVDRYAPGECLIGIDTRAGRIVMLSESTLNELGSLELAPFLPQPAHAAPVIGNLSRQSRDYTYDPVRHALLVRFRSTLVIAVPLEKLKINPEPPVVYDPTATLSLNVGTAWRLPLTPRPSVTISLKDMPGELHLKDGSLTWTPKSDDVGLHQIVLNASMGDRAWTQTIWLNVQQPSVALAFRPQEVFVTPNGETVVATFQHTGRKTYVAVLDAVNRRTITTKALPPEMKIHGVSDKSVLAQEKNNPWVALLSFEDLTETGRVRTRDNFTSLSFYDPWIFTQSDMAIEVHNVHTSRAADLPQLKRGVGRPEVSVQVAGDGIHIGAGLVLDRETLEPIGLDVTGEIASAPPPGLIRIGGMGLISDLRYGRYLTSNGLASAAGMVAPLQKRDSIRIMLSDQPAWLTLDLDANNEEDRHRGRIRPLLAIRDMIEGTVARQIRLQDVVSGYTQTVTGHEPKLAMASNGDRIAVAVNQRVFLLSASDVVPNNIRTPLNVQFKPSPLMVATGQQVVLEYEISGGTPPYRVQLLPSHAALTLEAERGRVVVSAPKFISGDLGPAASMAWQYQIDGRGGTPESRLREYAEFRRLSLKRDMGVDLRDVPAAVNVVLNVVDSEKTNATAARAVIVDVPLRAMERYLPDNIRAAAAGPGDKDLQQRLRELEAENEQLKKQVKLLTDLLTEQRTGKEK